MSDATGRTTHFGFQTVAEEDKAGKVHGGLYQCRLQI